MLKDGSVNKQIVAETIVSMGVHGVQYLAEFVNKESQANYKTRELIARAFSMASAHDPSIDLVIELLLNMASDKAADVRKACLSSLDKLRSQGNGFANMRDFLPFFYQFLADADSGVRNCAVLYIASTGAQGQFLLTEGLTKDKNAFVRKECARGLGKVGVAAFRALLLGLHDSNKTVRMAASEAILQNISEEELINFLR